MFVINLKKFDIFYFRCDTVPERFVRYVYLGFGMVTTEHVNGDTRKLSDKELKQEVCKVGKMISINIADIKN